MTYALNETFDLEGTAFAVRVTITDGTAHSVITRDGEPILDRKWPVEGAELPTDAAGRQKWAKEYVLAFLLSQLHA